MSALTKALEHIINWFHQSSLYHEPCLQAGLTYEEISEKVKALPFQLSEEVYELYQWKNGDQPGSVINSSGVINSYEFLPLESAIEFYQQLSEVEGFGCSYEREGFAMSYKGYPLFPLFEFNGEYLAVVSSTENKKTSPVILIDELGIADDKIRYTSLTSMVLTITECYETGAYYLDEIGIIQEDMSKVDEIYLKYNNQAKWFSSTLP